MAMPMPVRLPEWVKDNLETVIIAVLFFSLLLGGFAVVFAGKVTGQVATRLLVLGVALGVEIFGIAVIGIIAYYVILRSASSS